MAKSFSDVTKALEALDGGADFVSALTEYIDTQRKDASSTANKEAKNLRDRSKKYESTLKKLGETLELDLTGDDSDDKITEIKEKIKPSTTAKPGETDPETKKLLRELKENLETEKAKTASIQERSEKNLKKSKLVELLTKSKVHTDLMEDLVEMLSSKIKVVDGEKLRAMKDDEEITIEDFVGDYVKARPAIIQSTQQPGAGTKTNGGPNGGPSKSPELANASPTQKMAAGFAKSN